MILYPSICGLCFSVAQTAGETQHLPSHVSQPLDGKSRHFDIVSSREMHLPKVLFDRNPFVLCWTAWCYLAVIFYLTRVLLLLLPWAPSRTRTTVQQFLNLFISVSLKSNVYFFQKLKIFRFKTFDSDCQTSQMPQTETSLYSVPEQQQETNLEDICVPSAFD